MDSVTHIALGACMGEVFAGKKLGKKAMLWGALAQSLPDIDILASLWLKPSANLLAHRGFTHSILFCMAATVILALITTRLHRPHNISFLRWILFFSTAIFIHIFIDAFNNYGVGWFEPFDRSRISFNAIYVVDPLFSIWVILACIALLVFSRRNKLRKFFWKTGLGLSGLYLVFCLYNKIQIDNTTRKMLAKQHISYKRYFTTPAPLQNLLWYVVAGDNNGYYTGYRSVFDKTDTLSLHYFPRNDALLRPLSQRQDVQDLIRFSRQFYTIEQWQDTLVFNDLRFGQVVGWHEPEGKFMFHYFLKPQLDNTLVVQRGRFQGWNEETLRSLWLRIKGNN